MTTDEQDEGGGSDRGRRSGGPAEQGYLAGQLLIAMPTMRDPRFVRTVIYMCTHTNEGAMGLVVNRLIGSITFVDLLRQFEIDVSRGRRYPPIHFGGPVDTVRGFVLHTDDYMRDGSAALGGGVALTATIDILRAIASGEGPRRAILALGYAGWGPGQLEGEVQQNAWLSVDPDDALLFDGDLDAKWDKALAKLGVDTALLLSGEAGHA